MTIVKSPNEVRDSLLRVIKGGLREIGIENPILDPGTDTYVMMSAIANEISIAANNVNILADQLMADTATGEDLDRILGIYGLTRRGASQSSGFIFLNSTTSTLVAEDSQLVGPTGLIYEVTVGGTYSNGQEIPITSVDSGSETNLDEGDILTWVDTPAFTNTIAITSHPITGGVDAEDDDTARQRLLDRLANPPALGNWQSMAELAESVDNAVQKAFIYQAANGPATVHFALTGYTTDVSKSRELAETKVVEVTSAIEGQIPLHTEIVVTGSEDVPTTVVLGLILPFPSGSVDLGIGGGWRNFSPWPVINSGSSLWGQVTAVTSNVEFTIASTIGQDPVAGVTQIAWIDSSFKVKTATVLSFTGTGPYVVTVDNPFVGIAVDDLVMPAAANLQTYTDAVINHFGQMGPGNKITAAGLVPRAVRRPRFEFSWPARISAGMLREVFESSEEVQSAVFLRRTTGLVTGTDIADALPDLPTDINDLTNGRPKIYTPNRIAFYPVV